MTSALSTRQGLLTRSIKRLTSILDDVLYRPREGTLNLPEVDSEEGREYIRREHIRLRKASKLIKMEMKNVENSLQAYNTEADNLPPHTPQLMDVLEKVKANATKAEELLERAFSTASQIAEQREELAALSETSSNFQDTPRIKLAPVPIPKFSGRAWEWESFWSSFEYSVHTRNMDDVYKMSYLMDAMRGEALSSLKKFEVCGQTYQAAIEYLKSKYGNTQLLITQLVKRLEKTKARGKNMEDQRKLCEEVSSIVNQLQLKGEPIDGALLQQQILSKFSEEIQRHALRKKQELKSGEAWSTKMLLENIDSYIQTELDIRRHIELRPEPKSTEENLRLSRNSSKSERSHSRRESDYLVCFFCGKRAHAPRNCPEFQTREQRIEQMKNLSLCRNCGGADHYAATCTKGACRICGATGHHTSICKKLYDEGNTKASVKTNPTKTKAQPAASRTTKRTKQHFVSSTATEPSTQDAEPVLCMKNTTAGGDIKAVVLVGEALVFNPQLNALERVHILLDTGADRSFVSENLAARLQLRNVTSLTLKINTFGTQTAMKKKCGVTNLQVYDCNGTAHVFSVARVEHLTEPLQRHRLSDDDKRYLADNDIELSIKPSVREVQPQILLGCSDTFVLMDSRKQAQHTLPSGLKLIPSRLGYLISGHIDNDGQENASSVNLITTSNSQNDQNWERFLALESAGVREFSGTSHEEQDLINKAVWEDFEATIELQNDGYCVRLPWREEAKALPDNKCIAYRRLCAIWNKLQTTPEILKQYNDTFAEQIEKGILEEVDPDKPADGTIIHYLSHQAVITPTKEFTKLRVVFDASAHLRDQPSLNDVLYQGPTFLPMICDMLLRFRIGDIAIIADVEKAFLQVRLHPADRDATRCLWVRDFTRPPERDNIVQYRFTRVTFGLNCSPFLLAGTIKHHLNSHRKHENLAGELKSNVYVDNVILTASNKEEAILKYHEAKAIFKEMRMNLRGFQTNSSAVNEAIPLPDRSSQIVTKVLGVVWDSETDTIRIQGRFSKRWPMTKRVVSEQIASVYDPMGWITPLMLKSKLFLQSLWKAGYDWDTKLSMEHQQEWTQISENVMDFGHVMARKTTALDSTAKLILFADASHLAMASCAYIVTDHESQLLFAKSRLPNPKQSPTIPKLEMNAVTMAARMAHMIYSAVKSKIHISVIMIFTDSEIALSWLAKYPICKDAGVLVRNRVQEIRRIVADISKSVLFGHVSTSLNPADCATRGLAAEELKTSLWWKGPQFLLIPEDNWPNRKSYFSLPQDTQGEPEIEVLTNQICSVKATSPSDASDELIDWERHNCLCTAQGAVAVTLRFLRRLLPRLRPQLSTRLRATIPGLAVKRETQYINAEERKAALLVIVRNHQRCHVTEQLVKSVKTLNLQPDEYGVLHCCGRMDNAQIPELTSKPFFVAAKTPLAGCIVRDAHLPFHRGTSHTIAAIRERFWIPKLRQQVQAALRKCIACQKLNNLPFSYPAMGPLPAKRMVRTRPFENVGIDYFGPLTIKQGERDLKVYGLIITCMTTRLLHIEVAQDLSTEVLLMALRRFFARRGIPASITSDNAPSFLLGDQIMKDALLAVTNSEAFQTTMARKGIEWVTITPYAPWQGAFYERLIKSIKQSLYKTIGRLTVTKEELETFLVEVEGSLNCRPLTYQGSLYDDVKPLRPMDFINREIEVTYPFELLGQDAEDPIYLPPEEQIQLRTRRQTIEALNSTHKLTEKFWIMWHKEYLTSLREAHKRYIDNKRSGKTAPKIGTVVLLVEDEQPRNVWRLGRISALKTSNDGAIREVEVRLPNGHVLRRPVNRLVPLEIEDEELRSSTSIEPLEDNQRVPERIEEPERNVGQTRYNLRDRPRRDYSERHHGHNTANFAKSLPYMMICTLLALLCLPSATHATSWTEEPQGSLHCIKGGVRIASRSTAQYEVCSGDHCVIRKQPLANDTILFPPEITLHDYTVRWKILEGTKIKVMETECPAIPFCEHVQCWFCTATAFNPECNPSAALLVWTTIAYIFVAVIYTLCYVPLTLGKPCRVLAHLLILGLRLVIRVLMHISTRFFGRWRRRRNRDQEIAEFLRVPLIAIVITTMLPAAKLCQDVDIMSTKTTVCSQTYPDTGKCWIEVIDILKLNTFNQEACFRLVSNGTVLAQHKFLWKGLHLRCQKNTLMYTRNTEQKVMDAKRCAHSGSCTGNKCEDVNTTSLVPELHLANKYPGSTYCVESCGGPGCGCFYLSSGCLFYRLYHVPIDEEVYEIFRCTIWEESIKIDIHSEYDDGKNKESTVFLRPTIPIQYGPMKITLTSVTVPPTPDLQSHFISNGAEVALWKKNAKVTVQCESIQKAQELDCEVTDTCICQPAENRIRCACEQRNITSGFHDRLENRLPVHRPWITFESVRNNTVTAMIPSLVTAEILITVKGEVKESVKEVSSARCSIPNTIAYGCYQCTHGAVAEVVCSSNEPTRATVQCEENYFTVPCDPQGQKSRIRFSRTQARVRIHCSVTCGARETHFEITGILNWVRTIQGSIKNIVEGQSPISNEVWLPDFTHILDTLFSGYKQLIIAVASLLIGLVISYCLLWTCGMRIALGAFKLTLTILWTITKTFVRIVAWLIQRSTKCARNEIFANSNHVKLL